MLQLILIMMETLLVLRKMSKEKVDIYYILQLEKIYLKSWSQLLMKKVGI